MNIEQIAKVSYECVRALSEAMDDKAMETWDAASDATKDAYIIGVQGMIIHPAMTPEDLHAQRLELLINEGWSYGDTKDAGAKVDPALVSYSQLSAEEQLKSILFATVAKHLVQNMDSGDVTFVPFRSGAPATPPALAPNPAPGMGIVNPAETTGNPTVMPTPTGPTGTTLAPALPDSSFATPQDAASLGMERGNQADNGDPAPRASDAALVSLEPVRDSDFPGEAAQDTPDTGVEGVTEDAGPPQQETVGQPVDSVGQQLPPVDGPTSTDSQIEAPTPVAQTAPSEAGTPAGAGNSSGTP